MHDTLQPTPGRDGYDARAERPADREHHARRDRPVTGESAK